MSQLFAVMLSRGPAWNHLLPMEQQVDWGRHADFMDGLTDEGFVLLGGPLLGTSEVLLIIHANDEDSIRARLAADSWHAKGLLQINRILPWQLRLGSLP